MAMQDVLDIVNSDSTAVDDCFIVETNQELALIMPSIPVSTMEDVDTTPGGIQDRSRAIRAAFMAAKDPDEVLQQAKAMHFPVWLDYFIKMSPKEVQVKGQLDVRSLVAQMGPVSRNSA
jgi:hypothetical protein